MKRIKIITFINDREGRDMGEAQLEEMVNAGWRIVGTGGGTGAEMMWGFVILQYDDEADNPN